MEPISAAASIFGLLGAAAKVSESLIKFSKGIKVAPKLAQTVLQEVSEFTAILSQLERYLVGKKSRSRSYDNLLMVNQVVVTLTECVLIFSELEKVVESLRPAQPMRPKILAQWIYNEDAIRKLLVRLQGSKLSLSLMMTTLTWCVCNNPSIVS